QLANVGQFNDTIRDGIKGSVFDGADQGWATGKLANRDRVISGIVGNIDYGSGIGGGWGDIEPGQSVSYVEAHDNLTLYDKLVVSVPAASDEQIAQLHRFASSIAILAQGLTFIHAGQEFLRSKDGDTNSYKSPDSINALRWSERAVQSESVDYFRALIALRLEHPAFRMDSKQQIRRNLKFFDTGNEVIAYELNGAAVGDSWARIIVIHNAADGATNFKLPSGTWGLVSDGQKVALNGLGSRTGEISVPAKSTLILQR
ncbi:MAG: type pullulanase, partial [Actinomycetota bacterium]